MQRNESVVKIEKTIFFIMMWVFYSLNSRYLRIPYAALLRWGFLAALIFCVLAIEGVKIGEPPKLLVLYLIAVLPSVLFSIDKVESLVKILSLVIVLWGTYIYFDTREGKKDLETALKSIMWIMILFEVQSVVCLMLGLGNGDRATGVTTNPNTLGIYSNVALLSAFYLLTQKTDKKGRWFYLFIIAASAVTAILSGSRTALVTLFLNITVISFLKVRSLLSRIVFVIAVGVFGGLLMTGKLGDFGLPALQKLLEGDITRGTIWDNAIKTWKQFPFFGCGYTVSEYYNEVPGAEIQFYDFHNSFLTILAEIGVWGSLILGSAVLWVIYGTWKSTESKGKVSILQIAFLLILELLIAAWSESFLFAVGSTEACTFWVIISWMAAYKKKGKEELLKEQEKQGDKPWKQKSVWRF